MTTVIYAVSILFAIIIVISEIIRNKRIYISDILYEEYKKLFHPNQNSPELYGIYLANKQGYSHKRTNKKWTKKN